MVMVVEKNAKFSRLNTLRGLDYILSVLTISFPPRLNFPLLSYNLIGIKIKSPPSFSLPF